MFMAYLVHSALGWFKIRYIIFVIINIQIKSEVSKAFGNQNRHPETRKDAIGTDECWGRISAWPTGQMERKVA